MYCRATAPVAQVAPPNWAGEAPALQFVIAALVLAAGGSRRLGQPKQLLRYRGRSLVRRAAAAAIDAGCSPVLVVVGRDREAIEMELRDLPVRYLPNELWERGIGTSIRTGVHAAMECDAVIILTCDQPSVNAAAIRRLLSARAQRQKPIIASAYAGALGVPALFERPHFEALLSLSDAEGAKTVIAAHPDNVARVQLPHGEVDIDTAADIAKLGFRESL